MGLLPGEVGALKMTGTEMSFCWRTVCYKAVEPLHPTHCLGVAPDLGAD